MAAVMKVLLAVTGLVALASIVQPVLGHHVDIIAYNDQHGHIESSDRFFSLCSKNSSANLAGNCLGGFARIGTLVKQWRAKFPRTALFVHAGDEFTGTIWNLVYNGSEAAIFDNLVGVEVATLGNHEFDKGPQVLADNYLKKVNFPIVSCNVHATPDSPIYGLYQTTPLVKKLPNGLTIGIVGWTTTDTNTDSSPGPTVNVADYAPDVQRCINELLAKNITAIIGLGHAGVDVDQEVIRSTHGLSLVVGGHSHTFMWPPKQGYAPLAYGKKYPKGPIVDSSGYTDPIMAVNYPEVSTDTKGRQVPYYQALWGTHYMDTISAWIYEDGHVNMGFCIAQPVLLGGAASSNPVAEDPAVNAVIDQLLPPITVFRGKVIGHTNQNLIAPFNLAKQPGESNLGNVVADAMVYAFQHQASYPNFVQQYGPVNIAITNPGGLRVNIQAGDITFEQVFQVLPFGDYDQVVAISGFGLNLVLNANIPSNGQYLDVGVFSGVRAVLDASNYKTAHFTSLLVDNGGGNYGPIDPNKTYYVLVQNFIYGGGSGYEAIAQYGELLVNFGPPQSDDVVEYLQAVSPISGNLDGRLIVNFKA